MFTCWFASPQCSIGLENYTFKSNGHADSSSSKNILVEVIWSQHTFAALGTVHFLWNGGEGGRPKNIKEKGGRPSEILR